MYYIHYNIINSMIEYAKKSVMEQRVSAGILTNKNIKNIKCNEPTLTGSFHAEYNVIQNTREKMKEKKMDMIVIRINKNNDLCNARPCMNCLSEMKKNGFKHVYYSIDNETIVREKISDMVSIQISHALRLRMNIKYDTLDNYYENMIKKFFPKQIRKENMDKFIKYNLPNILPLSKVVISNKYMTINNNNRPLISCMIM